MDDASGGIPQSAISSALALIKEHPELLSAVASTISKASPPHSNPDQGSESISAESVPDSTAPSDASPFPVEKISEVMSALAPMLSELGGKQQFPKEITGSREEHRYSLLCSLRPYLSNERREIVDYILKFSKISELIKKIK